MRYFYMTFIWQNSEVHGYGHILYKDKYFPSLKEIINQIKSQATYESNEITVLNIFEFKNEEDFNLFNKE